MSEHSNNTILIIDDDNLFRRYLGEKLEKILKVKVVEAENPKIAFEIIKKTKPDLILLDMEMPVMDGYSALKLLRSIPSTTSIPVIACTALRDRDLVVALLKLKISDYIEKSTNSTTMVKKIKKVLDTINSNKKES